MGLTRLDQASGGPTWPAQVDGTASLVVIRPLPPTMSADPARRDAARRRGREFGRHPLAQRCPLPGLRRAGRPDLAGARERRWDLARRALATWGACGWAQAIPVGQADVRPDWPTLHAQGLIHGRLQPSNVHRLPERQTFGWSTTRCRRRCRGRPVPRYQAPDGARDAGSDLYSLGVIVYELLTGDRESLAPARLPADAAPAVAWLLRQSPAQPPRSAEEVIAALDGHLTIPGPGPAGDAPPSCSAAPWRPAYSPPPVGQSPARSASAIAIIAGLVLAAVVGLAVLGRWSSGGYVHRAAGHVPDRGRRCPGRSSTTRASSSAAM